MRLLSSIMLDWIFFSFGLLLFSKAKEIWTRK